MTTIDILSLCADWKSEFELSLKESETLCIAVFTTEGELLFANATMSMLFKGDAASSLLNPSLEKLINLNNSQSLIFQGFLTIGNHLSNLSIQSHIFRKSDRLLIIGGINLHQMLTLNEKLLNLNRENTDFQHQLIKDKFIIESTLKQLDASNETLKQLNATKDKFFSIIAHDLRNPFNVLMGFSDFLTQSASNCSPEEVHEIAQNMNEMAKQAYGLLENLLIWSRVQTGQLQPDMQKVNPSDILNEVVYICKPLAEAKGITLTSSLLVDEFIYADANMVKTVLRNLTTNAIKFTFPQGIIRIDTKVELNRFVFSVIDNGTGINFNDIDKLFKIDANLSKTGTADEKGTGLGLILCKEFVEKHDCDIWVESEFGKGSAFHFTMPLYER